MKIEGRSPVGGTPQARRASAKSKTGDGFSKSLEPTESDATAPSSHVQGSGPIHAVDALLAVQAVDDPLARRGRAVRRGHSMLDELEDLRRQILAGAIPQEQLERLDRLVSGQRDSVDDPQLVGVLDEIDLRVKVELAKLRAR